MLPVILSALAAAVVAVIVYMFRESVGPAGLGLAALRTVGLVALLLVFFNPASTSRTQGGPPTVLLDVSLSMNAAGSQWNVALDTARSLATGGTLLTFGSSVATYDSLNGPTDGASRLASALRVAAGRSGPVAVVTDGELDDIHGISQSLLRGVSVVVVERDTAANVALLDVDVNEFVVQTDTARITLTIGTWGRLDAGAATLDVMIGQRRVHNSQIDLPASPGTGRRTINIPSATLAVGTNVVHFTLTAPGDTELRDNTRIRLLTVTTQPGVVVLVDPADIEGRFLAREMNHIVRTGLRGFARVGDQRWLDMQSLSTVSPQEVQRVAQNAALVITRSDAPWLLGAPFWHWPAGTVGETEFFEGDWYVTDGVPASPVAGELASVAWDSLPPLTGIVPLVAGTDQWVALSGRLGRRGADRPLLIGEDSSGVRRLTTAAGGMWRWALRGGASLDAYRTVLSSGIDWLLDTGEPIVTSQVSTNRYVSRGRPVTFRWRGSDVPDSLAVVITGPDSTERRVLFFDASDESRLKLPPGVYRWAVPSLRETSGIVAVEDYSDEFHLRAAGIQPREASGGFALFVKYTRERWWLFAVAVAAFAAEWAWRQRMGLP